MSNRLELTWYGKENPLKIEPRILIEDHKKSNCINDPDTENMLIHGDNLLALKALEHKYTGKVKCIYIDPSYNIAVANPNYDDNLAHSEWLSLMKPRLEILRKLLSDDGAIFVQIDDEEQAYLKVLMDEIFGRSNFINCITVKISESSGIKMAHAEKRLPKLKEYILLYAKDQLLINPPKVQKDKWDNEYKTVMTNVTREELDFIKSVAKQKVKTEDELQRVDNILNKATYTSARC